MATFQQVINDARVILNDEVLSDGAVVRYTEPQLLGYAKQAVLEAKRIRPDLFLGLLTQSLPNYTAADQLPLPDEYVAPLTDYVVSRAEFRDDEFTVDGRMAVASRMFRSALLGIT